MEGLVVQWRYDHIRLFEENAEIEACGVFLLSIRFGEPTPSVRTISRISENYWDSSSRLLRNIRS